ncbi:LOW QUALITY PROTEIN: thiol S-methyltransferase TMT1A-like [Morphnus guianensis]
MTEASILFLRACLMLLAMPIYLLSFLGIWEPFCKKIFFPFFLEKFSAIHERKTKKQKQELFCNLPDFTRPSGELKLLGIGTGCSANFQFYPPGCRVTCTDTNPNFQQALSRSVNKNQLIHEHFLLAVGEDLHQVPSGSVDALICAFVLCSVRSVNGTMKEVLRLLRPGGAFCFLKHVAADHSSWKYFWQQICCPTWKLIFDGCCLMREIWKNLEQANFSELNLQHINVEQPWMPVRPHIIGYAVK